jgi:ABC-type Co2+ transport system permease subunit
MHLSDGVLEWPVLAGTTALAAVGVAWGMRVLPQARLPAAAVLTALFFVGGTLHIPVGVGSVHLVLTGLLGLMLGWAVFPVLLIGLVLQAALLSFGGFSVLGANLLILALPAALMGSVLRPILRAGLLRVRVQGSQSGRWSRSPGICTLVVGWITVVIFDLCSECSSFAGFIDRWRGDRADRRYVMSRGA